MSFQTAESRTKSGGRLSNVRRLWQCLALPAVLVLATTVVVTGCPGPVSAGETNSYPAPPAAARFTASLTVNPALPTATYGVHERGENSTTEDFGNAHIDN